MTDPLSTNLDADTAAIQGVLQTLDKGLRAFKLYLPNNPIFQRAAENIRTAFEGLWPSFDELVLHVSESDFVWDDDVVWSDDNKSNSITWTLYQDGVRTLTLKPGVERKEIVDFLHVIRRVGDLPADSPDDLLTLLWEVDFEFLEYTYLDVAQVEAGEFEEPADHERPVSETAVRQQLEEDVEETERELPGIVSMDDFDSTLYFLDDEEIEYLKSEIDREYRQDLNANILSMLFDLLELQKPPDVRDEVIETIENLLPHLLSSGDFSSVAMILTELRVVEARAEELIPKHRERLARFPHRLSEPDAIGQLLQSLDNATVHPTEEELGQLFAGLQPSALEHVLKWLPKLATERVRELLKSAAARLADEHPEDIAAALASDDPHFLIELFDVISRTQTGSAKFVPAVQRLLANPETAVRKAAGNALATIGSPAALKALETAVDDPDRDVRIVAVQHLASKKHRGVFAKIQAAIQGKALRSADLTEKKAFFEAFGMLAGASGVDALRPMLHGKGLFKRKPDSEVRACAAMALGKIGTPEARDVLSAAGREKDPLVKNAVGRALREIV